MRKDGIEHRPGVVVPVVGNAEHATADFSQPAQTLFIQPGQHRLAIGGYHLGKFAIKNRGVQELTDFYNTWIGMKIVEKTFGMTSYEGIIWQLDLIKNGVNYRRTLNPKYWHNRVKVKYTDENGSPSGIAWSENTSSSEIYGVMEYFISIGPTVSSAATALRDSELTAYAWPISRTIGSVDVSQIKPSSSNDGLYITTAGFMATANWKLSEVKSTTAPASTILSGLVGLTEFISSGRIETNSMLTRYEGNIIPQRVGDLIKIVIKQGDSSGNIWRGGVYADQKFIYEPVPTTIDYILQNGMLVDAAGTQVNPALLNPGFYVRDSNAPKGGQPPGTSNIWDDPQVSYCDEVEYTWPDKLRLKFPGEKQSVDILYKQIANIGDYLTKNPEERTWRI